MNNYSITQYVQEVEQARLNSNEYTSIEILEKLISYLNN